MADLLKNGHKMLSISCPICNNPIFQEKSGTTFCPICNRKVLLVDNNAKIKNEEKKPTLLKNSEIEDIKSVILPVLLNKFQLIAQKLKSESQLSVIEEYLDIISKLLSLVEKVKNLS
ncbi:MAG: Sjogren's syndrome/scleroderma autoantigen 1 family protein [Promethearchaeota archaeon]